MRSEVDLDYRLANPLEKCSTLVTRSQSPFKVVVLVRCKLHLISLSEVQNRQLKLGAAGYLSRLTSKVT